MPDQRKGRMIVLFECYEPQNNHHEEFEFADDATDEDIESEWLEWVLQQVVDNYGWRKMEATK